jgi:deoxyadenosine/deoxycytidine kinase
VSPLYLQQLNELYTAWIEDFTLCPILTVPADNLDFVRFSQDFALIKEKIMEKLAGREKVYFP